MLGLCHLACLCKTPGSQIQSPLKLNKRTHAVLKMLEISQKKGGLEKKGVRGSDPQRTYEPHLALSETRGPKAPIDIQINNRKRLVRLLPSGPDFAKW